MSSDQQERRRPFSVNDLNRRTREVKIFNTTTITTTTTSTTHDSSSSTTSITNRPTVQNDNKIIVPSDTIDISRKTDNTRSRSAFAATTATTSDQYTSTLNNYPNISTNTIVSLPSKRKIRFVYGQNQQNEEQKASETVYISNENLPGFPYVKSTLSAETSKAHITNSLEINKENLNDTYDNYKSDIGKNIRIKDVEVECEIDEDPAIFEGSEGYVRNLIGKIQTQYKNPETVHIKITRVQKPDTVENIQKNQGYGQIVKKEYYTVKKSTRPLKSSSISSFIDQSNIPFIDDEHLSNRNSRYIEIERQPNYVIEKHIIYGDNGKEEKKVNEKVTIKGKN